MRNFCLHPEFYLIEDNEQSSAERRATGGQMFRFVTSLFGCTHAHCTFPRTITKPGHASTTYVVCLDCGMEFPYDWEQMKVVASGKQTGEAVA